MTTTTVGLTGTPFRSPARSAFAISLSGMQTASGRLDADAQSIATNGPDVGSMVDLNVQTATYAALAEVIRARDEMTRSAVDLLA
jgi:flagellar basal body rod protein FlgC